MENLFLTSHIQLPKYWEGAGYITTAFLEMAYNIKDVSYTVFTKNVVIVATSVWNNINHSHFQ